ncbi:hypothetical protein J7K25_05385 [bacterium]|nr:hypothetical protein [bacterium]
MRGHVFVVNEETLPIHLEYQFVGVSSGGRDTNISLLADAFRVKKDDFIFFYIEGRKIKKDRFFGVFKAVDNTVYHLTGSNALSPDLPVKLIYRKKIKPYRVYQKGVLEWIALDKLPTYAKDLLWTLIYRKMKARRGNTMLFPWEVERLISLIKDENNGQYLSGQHFTFDITRYEITEGRQTNNHNIGIPVRLSLHDVKNSETHLQTYILENLSVGSNAFFPQIFGKNVVWIGNEVFAGSGMQKIDILTIEKVDEVEYIYRIIELKHPKSGIGVNFAPIQLEYYINWAREDIGGHILGGRKFNIKPVLVVLTEQSDTISEFLISNIKNLNSISKEPEIYELNLIGDVRKVL